MKNTQFLFITTAILSLAICKSTVAEIVKSGTHGTNCSYELDDKNVLRIFPTDNTKSTAAWTNNNVAGINREAVKEVIVEEGITSLDLYGLAYMYSVEKISLPNTLKSIGAWSFLSDSKLKNVLIPDSVTSIATGGENGGYWNAFLGQSKTTFYCPKHLSKQCKTAALYQNTPLMNYEIASDGTYIVYQGDSDEIKGAYLNLDDIVADKPVKTYVMNDEKNRITAKYDGRGNMLENYAYDAGGNLIKILNKDGKMIYGKKIYTPSEAAIASQSGSNTVSITW